MKTYHTIQPEVIVGLGDKTEFLEKEALFKTVTKLHIQLEDWLGDDLMECHPCYLITEELKNSLVNSKFSGFEISELEITKSEYFEDNYQQSFPLPKFYWLKINGKKEKDDFFIDDSGNFQVTDAFLSFLKKSFRTNYLDVNPEKDEFDDLLEQMLPNIDSKKDKTKDDNKKPPPDTFSVFDDCD